MIQISPDVSSLPEQTSSAAREAGGSEPLRPNRKSRKSEGKAGPFAKIFEGLLKKLSPQKDGAGIREQLSGTEARVENAEEKPLKIPAGKNKGGTEAAVNAVLEKNFFRGAAKNEKSAASGEDSELAAARALSVNTLPAAVETPSADEIVPEAETAAANGAVSGEEEREPLDSLEAFVKEKNDNPASGQSPADALPRRSWETVVTENGFSRLQDKGLVDEDRELKENGSVRGKDKKREKSQLSLEVHDQRSVFETNASLSPQDGQSENLSVRETELLVELKGHSREGPDDSGPRESGSVSFRDALARELREGLGYDIVRQASLVLKDGNEGLIRLSLRPESLGNVKIRLEMSENKIAGHIIVESDEALRAFEQEIQALEQTFRDSGFEGASIDLSQGGEGGGGWKRESEVSPFLSGRIAASNYDGSAEKFTVTENADTSVNMLI